jgi:topoisomerase IA-like protein
MATKKRAGAGQKKVGKVMHEFKHGELHSASKKGPKVKNPKQAIAIALSEARQSGANIPPKKGAKKTAGKKTAAKKTTAKKAAAKKTAGKKTARKG